MKSLPGTAWLIAALVGVLALPVSAVAREVGAATAVLELELRWDGGELRVLGHRITEGAAPTGLDGGYRFIVRDAGGMVIARGPLVLPRWLLVDDVAPNGLFTGGSRPLGEPFIVRIPFPAEGGGLEIEIEDGGTILDGQFVPGHDTSPTVAIASRHTWGMRDYLEQYGDRRPSGLELPSPTATVRYIGFLSDRLESGLGLSGTVYADDYRTGEEIASSAIRGRRNKFVLDVPPGEYDISIYASYVDSRTGAGVRYPVRVLPRVNIADGERRRIKLDRGYPFIARIMRRGDKSPIANAYVAILSPLGGLRRLLISDENGFVGLGMEVEDGDIVTLAVAPPEDLQLQELLRLQAVKIKRKRPYHVYLDPIGRQPVSGGGVPLWRSGDDAGRLVIVILGDGYTSSNETFTDLDSNGRWDGDTYLDANGNGVYNAGENYHDRNNNGTFDQPEPFDDLNDDAICNLAEQQHFLFDAAFNSATLLNTEPFRSNRGRINVYAVPTVSVQAGPSFPDINIERDNALGSYCEGTGDYLILSIDDNAVQSAASSVIPLVTQTVVIVHDPYAIGRGNTYFNFGRVLLSSSRLRYGLVLLHEFGHSIGYLHDEYVEMGNESSTYPYNTEPDQPNLTLNSDPAACKWRRFFTDPVIEVPTPYGYSSVGLFEGGGYHAYGIYRPTAISTMRSVYAPWGPVNMYYLSQALEQFR